MEGLRLKIRHVDGRSEELLVESDQVLIGSGAHCEVRLPLDQARFEHVVVRASHAGLFAEARAMDPPPTLNGAEFTEARMLPGSVLAVNQSAIEIWPITVSEEPNLVAQKTPGKNLRPAIIAALGIALSAAMILAKSRRKDSADEPKQVPDLFPAVESACPQTSAQKAEADAIAKLVLAKAKRERSPFQVKDGVAAVPLYRVAAACFRAAGRDESAREASADADRLKTRVAYEFHVHRMRLRYALGAKDWPTAQEEVKTLRAYTTPSGTDESAPLGAAEGEYAVWLSNLDRKIELTHGGKKGR